VLMRRKKKLYKQLNMIITSDHTHTHTSSCKQKKY